MSNLPPANHLAPAHDVPERVRVSGIAVALLVTALPLLLFGALTFIGTVSDEFRVTRLSTVVGIVMFWVGVGSFLSGLVLVGARSLVQQQLDALLRVTRHDGGGSRPH